MAQPRKASAKSRQLDPMLARRREQLKEVDRLILTLKGQIDQQRRERKQAFGTLESVSAGLYDEVDKLSKKSPADQVTDLMLEQVNEVIRDAKRLMPDDPYIQRQAEFVAAGENPENRDVLLVLRQVRQGLGRLKSHLPEIEQHESNLLGEARTIREALNLYVEEGRKRPTVELFASKLGGASRSWFTGPQSSFDFARLDETDLMKHFGINPS